MQKWTTVLGARRGGSFETVREELGTRSRGRGRQTRPEGPEARRALDATDEERAEDCREDEFCAVEELMLDKRFVPEPFLPQLAMERAAERRKARQARRMARELGAVPGRKQGDDVGLADDAPPKAPEELEEHEEPAASSKTFVSFSCERHSLGGQAEDRGPVVM